MMDLKNGRVFELKAIELDKMRDEVNEFLIDGEAVFAVLKTVRDQLVFTNKRIIVVNVQGRVRGEHSRNEEGLPVDRNGRLLRCE